MSPVFFSLFLNDVKMQLADIGNEGITLERLSIYLLLLLELNSKRGKKKVVVFRKAGNLARNEQ